MVRNGGGGGHENPSARSQHWSTGYYVQLEYDDPNRTATSVSVRGPTGPGITGSKTLTFDSGRGSGNSRTSTFIGWLEKNFAGIQVSPADTLKFWLRGVSYMLNDIKEEFPIAQTFRLDQNYPNPFNPTTQIQYNLPLTSFVTLKLYDVMGRELVTLVSQRQDPGLYNVRLDVGSFAAGIYFYRLSAVPVAQRDLDPMNRVGQAGTFTETKKLVLLR